MDFPNGSDDGQFNTPKAAGVGPASQPKPSAWPSTQSTTSSTNRPQQGGDGPSRSSTRPSPLAKNESDLETHYSPPSKP